MKQLVGAADRRSASRLVTDLDDRHLPLDRREQRSNLDITNYTSYCRLIKKVSNLDIQRTSQVPRGKLCIHPGG